MNRISSFSALAGLSVLAVAGCSDSTAPGTPLSLDAALSEMNSSGTYAAPGLATLGIPVPVAATGSAASCAFDASTRRFVCPTITSQGMTMDRWFQLLDASGAPLSAFDPTRVAAIRTVTDVSGSHTQTMTSPLRGTITMTLTQSSHGDQTLSGLLTGEHTLNGATNATMGMTSGGVTDSLLMKQTVTNLVLPTRPGEYPKSGSIAMEMSAPDSPTVLSTMTMTFDGTSTVTVTTTSAGQTTTCKLDLANPSVSGMGSCTTG